MPVYTYSARAINGELKNATIDAPSREEAVAQLRKQRLNVVKIDEAPKKKKGGKVPMRDIVIFTRQFSTMINAGLPLVQALDILANQSENKPWIEFARLGSVEYRLAVWRRIELGDGIDRAVHF